MANNNKRLWLVTLTIIAILLIGTGYLVAEYINKPDEIIGLWNGTIKYDSVYYESTYNFSADGYCNVSLYPKPGMTFNVTQPVLPPVIRDRVRWEKVNDSYDLLYPDGKVRLEYPDIPHTLRFSEEIRDGYDNSYIGYISKNYDNLQDFGT
jgi:hypothetical protein